MADIVNSTSKDNVNMEINNQINNQIKEDQKPVQANAHSHEHHHDHKHDHDHADHHHDHDHHHHHGKSEKAPSDYVSPYWLSLDQWEKSPEFLKLAEQEFISSPLREGMDDSDAADSADGSSDDNSKGGWARREFLKLMSASVALASTGCLRRPVEKIVPYVKQPEELTLGERSYYTSVWQDGVEGLGVLVGTREGRPIKVEGNPSHPINSQGLSARAQAYILSLYDPDRFKGPKRNLVNKEKTNRDTISSTWADLDKAVGDQLKKGSVGVLTGSLLSPSTRAIVGDFCDSVKAKHFSWDALSMDGVSEAQKKCYGEEIVPFYRFDRASVIVSFDADFLGTWLAPTAFSKQFGNTRRDIKKMSKLVVFDSGYSLTGANADIRIPVRPLDQYRIAMGIAHDLIINKKISKYSSDPTVAAAVQPFGNVSDSLGISKEKWNHIVDSLAGSVGVSLVVAGGPQSATTEEGNLQLAVNLLNSILENDGFTVDWGNHFVGITGSNKNLFELISAMEKGEIKTLLLHNVNPIYASPLGERFRQAAKKVEMIISSGDRNDETTGIADYVAPDHHSMENWGDLEVTKGVFSVQQPTIRPLYDTRAFQQSLLSWAKAAEKSNKRMAAAESYYDYLRNFWRDDITVKVSGGKNFESVWDDVLEKGFVAIGGASAQVIQDRKSLARPFKTDSLKGVSQAGNSGGKQLVLYSTVAFRDGSLGNVSWLHELPDPITKIVWDNHVSVSYDFAKSEKLNEGDMVEIKVGETKLKLPIHIQPGLHSDVFAVAVGYGRTGAGKVGNGIGGNAYPLALIQGEGNASKVIYSGQAASLKKLGYSIEIANVQGHHSMEGRQIVAEATQKEYLENNGAGIHKHHIFSIWPGHQYNGHKWGMSVDLNTCTGCSACMIACQSENNIPVVGKTYVIQGREMHWMRMDRYFVGDPKNAETVFQPVMCQQCDNAPCETVCPVTATAHSSEGLNDMAYNRCVGTRYCSNNCPYKVRRFNWFNFTGNMEKPLHLAQNPEVTVRVRGVMEKCTFCVHRIKSARSTARIEGRSLKDGDVQTACQQSCPTSAITFGDMNDPSSALSQKLKSEARAYALLEEFNAAPAVKYLSKIRNNGEAKRNMNSHGGHA